MSDENEKKEPDMKNLAEAFEAFNLVSQKLEAQYNIVLEESKKLREEVQQKNRELSELSNLIESVLMNSNSAIAAVSSDGHILMKNKSTDNLIEDIGGDVFNDILEKFSVPGVHETEPLKGRFFKVSVGALDADKLNGFVYVIDDMTELKNLEMERQRDEKLKLMGEMAANIAHEIRNPLGSIELFASLLGRDLQEMPEGKRLTGSIIKGVRTINSIISNILLFTKEIQIDMKEHYVSDIVDDVVLYLQHLMREKNVVFKNNIGDEDKVACDAELLKQVIMNLIHNAVEAVSEGGGVSISSEVTGDTVSICVTDTGSGIDKEMAGKLFMPFQTTKAKGTGLGLAIVYKIIKAHGGQISANSEEKTTFEIKLPSGGGEI